VTSITSGIVKLSSRSEMYFARIDRLNDMVTLSYGESVHVLKRTTATKENA
ncbi:hypothetical protein THOM_1197, partial [Trachipleistophora hominis]